jgi:hypothetical protein
MGLSLSVSINYELRHKMDFKSCNTIYDVRLEKHKYGNGRTALTLVDAKTGEQVTCATVNLHEHELGSGEVFIKLRLGVRMKECWNFCLRITSWKTPGGKFLPVM